MKKWTYYGSIQEEWPLWYYYIGTGLPGSFSEAADIQYILDLGQKYSSLDFISDFQETKEDPQ